MLFRSPTLSSQPLTPSPLARARWWHAFGAGAVAATGFAPLSLWPVALVALALGVATVAHSPSVRRAAWLGWWFGWGHFIVGLNWIATAFTFQAAMPAWLGWIGVVLVAAWCAVFPALAAAVTRAVGRAARPWTFVLAGAAAWTLSEWLRGTLLTGFPWNPLAAIAVDMGWAARVVGTYGLSGLVVAYCGAGWLAMRRDWASAAAIIASATAVTLYGLASALGGTSASAPSVNLTVVQPNIGQDVKWDTAMVEQHRQTMLALSSAKPTTSDAPRIVLWPESAIPDAIEDGYPSFYYRTPPADVRRALARSLRPQDTLLLGATGLDFDANGVALSARNSVASVRPDGTATLFYSKAHLVPFGEYVPLRAILTPLGLTRLAPGAFDFVPGPGPRTFRVPVTADPTDAGAPRVRVAPQICYEIIFSGHVVNRRVPRPDMIFNPSNDAWFGAWGPPQHLAQARLRALEEAVPVVRSTPTGISAVIDARGRVLAHIPAGQAGRIDTGLPQAEPATLFARFGNVVPLTLGWLILVATALLARLHGRPRRAKSRI